MKTKIIHSLITSDSGIGNIVLAFNGLTLIVYYEANSTSGTIVGSICFRYVVSYTFTDEAFAKSFTDGSFDTVVEIVDSRKIYELNKGVNSCFVEAARSKHYCVFLSNIGQLDVFAEEIEILDTVKGTLGEVVDMRNIIGD